MIWTFDSSATRSLTRSRSFSCALNAHLQRGVFQDSGGRAARRSSSRSISRVRRFARKSAANCSSPIFQLSRSCIETITEFPEDLECPGPQRRDAMEKIAGEDRDFVEAPRRRVPRARLPLYMRSLPFRVPHDAPRHHRPSWHSDSSMSLSDPRQRQHSCCQAGIRECPSIHQQDARHVLLQRYLPYEHSPAECLPERLRLSYTPRGERSKRWHILFRESTVNDSSDIVQEKRRFSNDYRTHAIRGHGFSAGGVGAVVYPSNVADPPPALADVGPDVRRYTRRAETACAAWDKTALLPSRTVYTDVRDLENPPVDR